MSRTYGLVISLALASCASAHAGDEKNINTWKLLFNGKTLAGWKETNFGGEGEVHVENGAIVMERGTDMTGITYTAGDFPKMNYEVSLEGKRVKGLDFFCTTTFPVGDTHCSLVVGGWAGSVVGLSTIDGADAMRNDTKTLHDFKDNQWYRIRIRVTGDRIQAWIDDKQVVNLATKGKKISIRAETDLCRPFGIATWSTVGAVRDIKVRSLTADEVKGAEPKKDNKRKLRFTISKETTYITEPLDKEGYPDYVTALNDRLRKGVTAKHNAYVLLVKAIGPRPYGTRLTKEFYDWLETTEPPDIGEYLLDGAAYLRNVQRIDKVVAEDLLDDANARPWSAKDYPSIAAWVKANESPLALVIEASKRERGFHPYVPPMTRYGRTSLMSSLLPAAQKCREMALALSIRVNASIAAGRYEEAWQDILALHRLARLVAQGGSHVEQLVAVALETIASQAGIRFVQYAEVSPKKVMDCLADLQQLPPLPSLVNKVEWLDRFTILQIIMMIDRHGINVLDDFAGAKKSVKATKPGVLENLLLANVDWNPALREVNRWHDRISAVMRIKEHRLRATELDKIVSDIKSHSKAVRGFDGIADVLRDAKNLQEGIGNRIGDILIALLTPAFQKVQEACDRTEQIQRNTHLAFALAGYQKDHGRYPKSLDALAPKYLAQIPEDLFSGKALKYRPKDNGYLLYSVGPNGVDEEGHWYDDDPPGDDPRVRMPLPPPKRD